MFEGVMSSMFDKRVSPGAQGAYSSETSILKKILGAILIVALVMSLFSLNAFFVANSLYGEEPNETKEVAVEDADGEDTEATEETDPGTTSIGPEPTPTAYPLTTKTFVIDDPGVALAWSVQKWALVNLMLMTLSAILATIVLIVFFTRRPIINKKGTEIRENRSIAWPFIGLALALATIVIFIVTQNLTLTMGYTDGWTITFVLILLAQIAFTVLALQRAKTAIDVGEYVFNSNTL